MTDTVRLKQIIRDSGLKLGNIAERLGLSRYGFARKLNNQSEFTQKEIEILCDVLHITKLKDRFSIFFAKQF